jgi:membrane associated rhomboid family serine protease
LRPIPTIDGRDKSRPYVEDIFGSSRYMPFVAIVGLAAAEKVPLLQKLT